VAELSSAHTDRRRAESFGTAAEEYDRRRPRYPDPLIAGLITGSGLRTLDVGSGTGIAAMQLAQAGADVLAVEPDERMSALASAKGIRVEGATFEEWQPAGRQFDLVAFALSFHWVDPDVALRKVATILRGGGRLALLANRVIPTAPTQQELDGINSDYLDLTARSVLNADEEVATTLEKHGFSVEQRRCVEELHYATDDYLNLVATYSNHLTLDPAAHAELRARLAERIGPAGVRARNDALALLGTPR